MPDAARYRERLTIPKEYPFAVEELAARTGENGDAMLAYMLDAALLSREKYRAAGIPESVFTETFRCFSRFVREHKKDFGEYGFDRYRWTGRMLSLVLFRIGTLEYETTDEGGSEAVFLHIPSDADLSAPSVSRSLAQADEFLRAFAPRYADAPRKCHSWLLAPALGQFLPQGSRIAQFRKRFRIGEVFEDDRSYEGFLFGGARAVEDYPEDTSLRRAVKAYLSAGGKLGAACGTLDKNISFD